MLTKVGCSVVSCHYNDSRICEAPEIMVKGNSASQGGDMEVGTIGSGTTDPSTSSETMCETFVPRSGSSTDMSSGPRDRTRM